MCSRERCIRTALPARGASATPRRYAAPEYRCCAASSLQSLMRCGAGPWPVPGKLHRRQPHECRRGAQVQQPCATEKHAGTDEPFSVRWSDSADGQRCRSGSRRVAEGSHQNRRMVWRSFCQHRGSRSGLRAEEHKTSNKPAATAQEQTYAEPLARLIRTAPCTLRQDSLPTLEVQCVAESARGRKRSRSSVIQRCTASLDDLSSAPLVQVSRTVSDRASGKLEKSLRQ